MDEMTELWFLISIIIIIMNIIIVIIKNVISPQRA